MPERAKKKPALDGWYKDKVYDNYLHPETFCEDIIEKDIRREREWDPEKKEYLGSKDWDIRKIEIERPGRIDYYSPLDQKKPGIELCQNCSLTNWDLFARYVSRVRLQRARGHAGTWSVGSRWLLKDQPNNDLAGNDYITLKYLQEHPGHGIPVPEKVMELCEPEDEVSFTLTSRVEGDTLHSVYPTLTKEEIASYRQQMITIIRNMRSITAPYAQKADGTLLGDRILNYCGGGRAPYCSKIGRNNEEWFAIIDKELRSGIARVDGPEHVETTLQKLKDNFPQGSPYVLSHMDLHMDNIIVRDGKVVAIVDWEFAGFYPWWAEYWAWRRLDLGEGGPEFFRPIFKELFPGMQPKNYHDMTNPWVSGVQHPVNQVAKYAGSSFLRHDKSERVLYHFSSRAQTGHQVVA